MHFIAVDKAAEKYDIDVLFICPAVEIRRIVENGVYYNVVPRGLYGNVSGEPHMRESDEKNITLMIYEQLRALKRVALELNLKDNDIEDVLYNNAKRILNLK